MTGSLLRRRREGINSDVWCAPLCCREFLARCQSPAAVAANSKCEVLPKVRIDNQPPVVELTFCELPCPPLRRFVTPLSLRHASLGKYRNVRCVASDR
eukprot:1187199-Prorocentrum_minimum.AAC.3